MSLPTRILFFLWIVPVSCAAVDTRETLPDGWRNLHVYTGKLTQEKLRQVLGTEAVTSGTMHAQVGQDRTVVEDVYADSSNRQNRYFLDLAANDAVFISNTLTLERDYGWEGLCIEPVSQYWLGLSHRKCTTIAAVIGETTGKQVSFEVYAAGYYSGVGISQRPDDDVDKRAVTKKNMKFKAETHTTVSLRDVLHMAKAPKHIDYWSLDCEGCEKDALASFPWDTHTVALLSIERPGRDEQDKLKELGFVFLRGHSSIGDLMYGHKSLGLASVQRRIESTVHNACKKYEEGTLPIVEAMKVYGIPCDEVKSCAASCLEEPDPSIWDVQTEVPTKRKPARKIRHRKKVG